MSNFKQDENLYDKLIDLELAKSEAKTPAKKLISMMVVTVSFYYSFLLGLGMLLGYLGAKVYCKYFVEQGKVESIYINCGKNIKIHMHHWILWTLFLAIIWIIDFFYLPKFFLGVVLGIIGHDIYDYNDWHKIFVLEKN